jgi:hypothetical protein
VEAEGQDFVCGQAALQLVSLWVLVVLVVVSKFAVSSLGQWVEWHSSASHDGSLPPQRLSASSSVHGEGPLSHNLYGQCRVMKVREGDAVADFSAALSALSAAFASVFSLMSFLSSLPTQSCSSPCSSTCSAS